MNYQAHYDNLINRAVNRVVEGYTEKHHIVPRCMGGSNDKSNLVVLTAREHFIAHLLLAKLHGAPNPKLWCAVQAMSMVEGNVGRTSRNRMVGFKREAHSKAMSILMSGENNPSRGITWNHTAEAKKKISEAKKGKSGTVRTQEMKDNQSKIMSGENNPNYGKTWNDSEETIQRKKDASAMRGVSPWNTTLSIAKGTQPIWGCAYIFYQTWTSNKDSHKRYGVTKLLCDAEYKLPEDISEKCVQNILNLFKGGWVPMEDIEWVRDFIDATAK